MQKKLNMLLQALQDYHPQRIILFGSVARGDADAESDLDVLVIKDTTDPFVSRLEVMAALCPLGVRRYSGVYAGRAAADARRRQPFYPPSPPRRQDSL